VRKVRNVRLVALGGPRCLPPRDLPATMGTMVVVTGGVAGSCPTVLARITFDASVETANDTAADAVADARSLKIARGPGENLIEVAGVHICSAMSCARSFITGATFSRAAPGFLDTLTETLC
jgi:hypothetical protein